MRVMLKRAVLWLALTGAMVYGLGSCSFKSIGAGLLSDFLTNGGSSTLGSTVDSGLGSLLSQLLGGTSA